MVAAFVLEKDKDLTPLERLCKLRHLGRATLNPTFDRIALKVNKQEQQEKASGRPAPGGWQQMNRKQRREWTRKMQAEETSLQVIHPNAAGIDIDNESHYVAVSPVRDGQNQSDHRKRGGDSPDQRVLRTFHGNFQSPKQQRVRLSATRLAATRQTASGGGPSGGRRGASVQF
jgi:hypothetical protein